MNVLFFGSTTDSVVVLSKLSETYPIACVVTQPARPFGRKQTVTATPVEIWAKQNSVPTFSFPSDRKTPWIYDNEQTVTDTLAQVDAQLLITASYGQKIPEALIRKTPYGGLNVHPSLLPRWRGADPVPWAILTGDRETGVTIVTLTPKFDEGKIIAQQHVPISDQDFSDPLRTKLFTIGADLLLDILSKGFPLGGSAQRKGNEPYARKFTRDDGFEPWTTLLDPGEAVRINRKFRALHPWPGVWTLWKTKRLKILGFTESPTIVQLDGKKPVSYRQFASAYL